MEEENLNPSKLGTKSFWKETYETELQNFNEFGDVGEIWFGTACERRIVQWLCKHVQEESAAATMKILDLGCGNGNMLISLAKKGFANLVGVDYSEEAVMLAQQIAQNEKCNILFKDVDILQTNSGLESAFDVVLDKGTYDAVSLMDSPSARSTYKENLLKFFRSTMTLPKIFIIASCNWTKDELINFFAPEFQLSEELDAPVLQFGGKTGKCVTTVVFNLRSDKEH